MERLLQLARKDLLDSIRERELYVLGVFFVVIGVGVGYVIGRAGPGVETSAVAQNTLAGLAFFGSIATIAVSYNQIVGKRSSGELRVLLSLPFSRLEVTYGTFLGRWTLLAMLSTLTIVLAGAIATILGATVGIAPLLGAIVGAIALTGAFVSLSIGLSAASANTTVAAAGAFSLLIVFLFRLWELMPYPIRYVLNGFSNPTSPPPAWARAWGHLAPIAGIRNALAGPLPRVAESLGGFAAGMPPGNPVYVQPWFGALVVVVWIALPVTLGFAQLRTADL